MFFSDNRYLEGSIDKCNEKRNLNDQNKRHTVHEGAVPCFVTKSIHSENGTYTSANDRNDKKGCFRNPEGPFFRFVFIDAHQGKSNQINCCNIGKQHGDHVHKSILPSESKFLQFVER